MASITLRSAVGRPLTNSEVDANFSALNLELGQKLVAGAIVRNSNLITGNESIGGETNGNSVGPIYVASNATVTVESGSIWNIT